MSIGKAADIGKVVVVPLLLYSVVWDSINFKNKHHRSISL